MRNSQVDTDHVVYLNCTSGKISAHIDQNSLDSAQTFSSESVSTKIQKVDFCQKITKSSKFEKMKNFTKKTKYTYFEDFRQKNGISKNSILVKLMMIIFTTWVVTNNPLNRLLVRCSSYCQPTSFGTKDYCNAYADKFNCEQHDDEFDKFENSFIGGNNMKSLSNTPFADCKNKCLQEK